MSLGVSRPTVREALIALEVDGRVRIRVGSGIYVQQPIANVAAITPPWAGPFEILAARALFESAIAEQAAHLATPADVAAIDAVLARMHAVDHSGAASVDADRCFHLAIAGTLGNEAISKVVGDLFDQRINPYFARLASYFETTSSWRAACSEHQLIRDRIAERDAISARDAMRRHLEQSQARFSITFGEAPETKALPIKARTAATVARPRAQPHRSEAQNVVINRRKSP